MNIAAKEIQLVELIYSALLGETAWQDFLDALSARLPDGKATLFMHDSRSGRGSFNLSSGLSERSSADYAEHFAATNLWMPPVAVRPLGEGVMDHVLMPRALLYKSEFYNDFLRSNNIGSSAGITIERNGSFAFMLTTLAAGFNPDETEATARLLERLYPHLKRASNFYRDGAGASLLSDVEKSLFDAAGSG